MLRGLEGWHIVIIAGLLVVLFGSRKMPDAARSIGQSLRIFKSEMKAAAGDGAQPAPQQPAEQPATVATPRLAPIPAYRPVDQATMNGAPRAFSPEVVNGVSAEVPMPVAVQVPVSVPSRGSVAD